MAFRELTGLARELYLKKQVQELTSLYGQAQRSIVGKLRSLDLTKFERTRAEAILKQVNAVVASLDSGALRWAKKTLPYSYERGVDIAAERLRALEVTRFVDYDAKIHTQAINVIVDDVTVSLLAANRSIGAVMSRFLRTTQQTLIQDREISRLIGEGLLEGSPRRTVSDSILGELRDQMDEEQFIVINGRNYKPDLYAKLVARTRTREATTQGTINTSLRYGVDLTQVDVHQAACEYCQQFSGRVFSISGTDEDFPALKEQPPFHPNCECVLVPVTRRALERRGYLDEVIKLSNRPSIEIPSFTRFEEVLSEL